MLEFCCRDDSELCNFKYRVQEDGRNVALVRLSLGTADLLTTTGVRYVNEVVDNYPIDDMKFVDDALRKLDEGRGNDLDTAMLALAAAGVGASGIAVAQPKEQEVTPEQIMALQQAGLI